MNYLAQLRADTERARLQAEREDVVRRLSSGITRQNGILSRVPRAVVAPRSDVHAAGRQFVAVTKPISKRSAKSMGSKTLTLKVKNWQINAGHFS